MPHPGKKFTAGIETTLASRQETARNRSASSQSRIDDHFMPSRMTYAYPSESSAPYQDRRHTDMAVKREVDQEDDWRRFEEGRQLAPHQHRVRQELVRPKAVPAMRHDTGRGASEVKPYRATQYPATPAKLPQNRLQQCSSDRKHSRPVSLHTPAEEVPTGNHTTHSPTSRFGGDRPLTSHRAPIMEDHNARHSYRPTGSALSRQEIRVAQQAAAPRPRYELAADLTQRDAKKRSKAEPERKIKAPDDTAAVRHGDSRTTSSHRQRYESPMSDAKSKHGLFPGASAAVLADDPKPAICEEIKQQSNPSDGAGRPLDPDEDKELRRYYDGLGEEDQLAELGWLGIDGAAPRTDERSSNDEIVLVPPSPSQFDDRSTRASSPVNLPTRVSDVPSMSFLEAAHSLPRPDSRKDTRREVSKARAGEQKTYSSSEFDIPRSADVDRGRKMMGGERTPKPTLVDRGRKRTAAGTDVEEGTRGGERSRDSKPSRDEIDDMNMPPLVVQPDGRLVVTDSRHLTVNLWRLSESNGASNEYVTDPTAGHLIPGRIHRALGLSRVKQLQLYDFPDVAAGQAMAIFAQTAIPHTYEEGVPDRKILPNVEHVYIGHCGRLNLVHFASTADSKTIDRHARNLGLLVNPRTLCFDFSIDVTSNPGFARFMRQLRKQWTNLESVTVHQALEDIPHIMPGIKHYIHYPAHAYPFASKNYHFSPLLGRAVSDEVDELDSDDGVDQFSHLTLDRDQHVATTRITAQTAYDLWLQDFKKILVAESLKKRVAQTSWLISLPHESEIDHADVFAQALASTGKGQAGMPANRARWATESEDQSGMWDRVEFVHRQGGEVGCKKCAMDQKR